MSSTSPSHATFLVAALFTVGIATGAGTGYAAAARAQDPYAHLERFADVLVRIQANYVDDISTEDLVDAALKGMMSRLDEHSRWLSAEETHQLEEDTQGSYEGIGVEVKQDTDGFAIARVLPNGPAQFAGLAPGDRIVAVNGEPMQGMSLDDLSDRLKGPRGEEIRLSVLRDGWGTPQEIPTVRDRIHTPSVDGLPFGDVAYVRLSQFQKGASDDLKRTVDELRARGATKGLILDLRDNPGGLLEEAVGVSDLFLDQGIIVSTRGRIDGPLEYYASAGGYGPDLKVVVLVNGLSASASEIVASALQDTHRGVLVGEPTYGKGSVQTLYTYPDDSALKLTIARYYTPSGQPVADHRGRVPDYIVSMPTRSNRATFDEIEARISKLEVAEPEKKKLYDLLDELPQEREVETDVPWDLLGDARLAADPPLAKALDLLK